MILKHKKITYDIVLATIGFCGDIDIKSGNQINKLSHTLEFECDIVNLEEISRSSSISSMSFFVPKDIVQTLPCHSYFRRRHFISLSQLPEKNTDQSAVNSVIRYQRLFNMEIEALNQCEGRLLGDNSQWIIENLIGYGQIYDICNDQSYYLTNLI